MSDLQLGGVFLGLLTVIGWANTRFLRLPTGVAMLGAGVIAAVVLLAAQRIIEPFWGFDHVRAVVAQLDFSKAVLADLLAFLLFAAGLKADPQGLRRRRAPIWTLATLGVLVSTAVVGFGLWEAARLLGYALPLPWALTFAALISPTDPVAVGAALKSGAVSPRLGAVLQGEGLFNDGVGIVAFAAMQEFATSGRAPHPVTATAEILLAGGGGLLLGYGVARLTALLMRQIDDHVVETTATLALAVGVYALALAVHVSGPLAAAAAGLVVGREGLAGKMSAPTRGYVEATWTLIDEILNAFLFLLLGLQVFIIPFSGDEAGLCLLAIVLVLLARFVAVLPWGAAFRLRNEERGASLLLTLGGLRGAVSLALALSLPHGPYRDLLLTLTFVVVAFSVLVQGLVFGRVAARLGRQAAAAS